MGILYLLQYRAAWASAGRGVSGLPQSLAWRLHHRTVTSVLAYQSHSCLPALTHSLLRTAYILPLPSSF